VVLSLYGIAPNDKIRFQRPTSPLTYGSASLKWGESSVETMAQLGMTSVVTIADKFSANYYCYKVDVLATATVSNTIPDTLIPSATFGIGFTIGLIAFNLKNNAKVDSPGVISASSTLNVASSVYQVCMMGGGLDAMPLLKPLLLASTAAFDVQTFQTLGAVEAALQDYLTENSSTLIPSLLSVTVNLSMLTKELYPTGTGNYLADVLAQTFAFERAYHNNSLDETLKDKKVAAEKLNVKVIEHVFLKILGLASAEKPTNAAKVICDLVLHAGRY
jgi:hypothetical protein